MHGMGLLLGKRTLARSALPAAPRKSHWQVQFRYIVPAAQQFQESNYDDVTHVEYKLS
jgi:hypothetical protein